MDATDLFLEKMQEAKIQELEIPGIEDYIKKDKPLPYTDALCALHPNLAHFFDRPDYTLVPIADLDDRLASPMTDTRFARNMA